ncbi:MAG: polysaccharide deacetylase family protein [Gemmatimonadota bacterium]
MATGWKRTVERLAARSGLTRAWARLAVPSTAILAYHNIVPHGEPAAGDVSLHVDQRAFGDQLDFLLEWGDIVPLDTLSSDTVSRAGRGARRPQIVVTFDDAYRGTMTAGVEELRARGVAGTVFVPPGLLGLHAFWWDTLAPAGGGPLADKVRDHALGPLAGRQGSILEWAVSERIPVSDIPEHACPCDEASLLRGASYEPLTLGAHTWSHPNLARVPLEESRNELLRCRSWLAERAPRYLDWLAYPYGLRTGETVALASEHFAGALLVDGGLARAHGKGRPRREVPRINVPRGLTLEGLALRLAGLLA